MTNEPSDKKRGRKAQVVDAEVVSPVALIPADAGALSGPAEHEDQMSPEESLKLAERRVEYFKGIVQLIAKSISPERLLIYARRGNLSEQELLKLKVYLPAEPCQRILTWAGVTWKPDASMIERRDHDEQGEFIEYDVWVSVITPNGQERRVMGSCSTRDPFFGVAYTFYGCPACRVKVEYKQRCAEHPDAKPRRLNVYRPLCDVDRGDVRKKALTNCWNKAVDALGLCPTLADLKSAGVDINKISRAAFGQDTGEGEEQQPPHQTPTQSRPPAQPEPQQAKPASAPQSAPTPAPQAAAPAPGPMAAPKANIPPPPAGTTPAPAKARTPGSVVRSTIQAVYTKAQSGQPLRTSKGSVFVRLAIDGEYYTVFDNCTRSTDGRNQLQMFDILGSADKNAAIDFVYEDKKLDNGSVLHNITQIFRVGLHEWDESGVSVLRRDPVQQQGSFQANDQDIPF